MTAVGVVVLWPRQSVRGDVSKLGLISQVDSATVVKVAHGPCGGVSGGPNKVSCTKVTFKLTEGPAAGRRRTIEFAHSPSTPHLSPGDEVVLNHVRMCLLALITPTTIANEGQCCCGSRLVRVAVIALGRLRGLAALVSLGASIVVILQFMLPSMLDGNTRDLWRSSARARWRTSPCTFPTVSVP